MFLHLFVVAAIGQGALFHQLFPHPTGDNAYEDYVQAADLVSSSDFQALEREYRYRTGVWRRDINAPKEPLPQGISENETPLEIERITVSRYQSALDLVHLASEKPISSPRYNNETSNLHPEDDAFDCLRELNEMAIEVGFADGRKKEAVQAMEDETLFDGRILFGPFANPSFTGLDKIFSMISSHQRQLSLPDTKRLLQFLPALCATTNPIPMVSSDEAIWLAMVAEGETKPSSFRTSPLQDLSDEEISLICERLTNRLAQILLRYNAKLEGSEKNWLTAFNDVTDDSVRRDTGPLGEFEDRYVEIVEKMVYIRLNVAEINLERLRIACLTLKAISYR